MGQSTFVNVIKSAHFDALIKENGIVILDFWAEWCMPCKQFAQTYEKVAAQYPTILFGKVNVEEESELAEIFQIRSIPHLVVFKEGIAIYSEAGSMPESTLKELIEQALIVDVTAIRQQVQDGEAAD